MKLAAAMEGELTSPVLAALQRATRTVPIVFVGVSWPLSDRAATARDAASWFETPDFARLLTMRRNKPWQEVPSS